MGVNIREMAKIANVSIATISRATNPETRLRVAPETLKRLERLMQKHAYTPNLAAKNLARSATKTIGVIFPYVKNVFFSSYYINILAGVANDLLGTEYQFKLLLLKDDQKLRDHFDFKVGEGVDGLIITQWFRFFSRQLVAKKINVPFVIINDYEAGLKASFVCGDHFEGGRMAGECLYRSGHRQVAVIAGPEWSRDSDQRVKGFLAFWKKAGQPLAKNHIATGDYDDEAKTRQAVEEILKQHPGTTAFFCCNDNMAFMTIEYLKSLGVSCPGKISVLGYDDDFRAEGYVPPLTTIQAPVYRMAQEAVRLLLSQLHQSPSASKRFVPRVQWIPVSLKERDSVRRLRG